MLLLMMLFYVAIFIILMLFSKQARERPDVGVSKCRPYLYYNENINGPHKIFNGAACGPRVGHSCFRLLRTFVNYLFVLSTQHLLPAT